MGLVLGVRSNVLESRQMFGTWCCLVQKFPFIASWLVWNGLNQSEGNGTENLCSADCHRPHGTPELFILTGNTIRCNKVIRPETTQSHLLIAPRFKLRALWYLVYKSLRVKILPTQTSWPRFWLAWNGGTFKSRWCWSWDNHVRHHLSTAGAWSIFNDWHSWNIFITKRGALTWLV